MAAQTDHLEHTNIYNRNLDDSEESDGEGGLGNVSRVVVRPPGHSGKAKRGQLCFDAAFECGNLGRADHVSELEYDLYLRPDTCRPRSRFWFNFTVENVRQDQRVLLNIVNLGKENTLFNGDMTPLVRSTSRQKWQRIPRRLVFYCRSAAHRGRRVLSVAFAFDREEDVYQFAAAAPYSYSRLQKHLAAWGKRAQAFATRESIAQTTQKRRVDLITIGDMNVKDREVKEEHPTKGRVPDTKRRVVLVMARAHGGEQPASYVCQGFLDYILSSSEKASALRNGIVVQVIPMLNPDGVFLGNQRSDLLGSDLNRCWGRATSFAHPGLIAVQDLVNRITAEKTIQLDFIIDIHADVSHEGVFVRGNSYDDVYRFERHAVLPKLLAARVEAWQPAACHYNADGALAGCARRALPAAAPAGSVDAYTLLASMGGRRMNATGPYLHYTEDAYAKIGRSLVKALCDYYRHVGVIPPRVGLSKKKEPRGRRRRRRPVFPHGRSPSSSPERERRVLLARVLSPPLPPAPEPAHAPRAPPRLARRYVSRAAPRTLPGVDTLLPYIAGTAVRTPRLAVLDLSAHVRCPAEAAQAHALAPRAGSRPRRVRAPRSAHPRLTSDECDAHDSDS